MQVFNLISKDSVLTFKTDMTRQFPSDETLPLFFNIFGFLQQGERFFVSPLCEIYNSDEVKVRKDKYLSSQNVIFDKKPEIRKFFDALQDDEAFYFKAGVLSENDEKLLKENLLAKFSGFECFEDFRQHREEFIDRLCLKDFYVVSYGQEKDSYIGEPDKKKRICRFCKCGPDSPKKFKLKAHAISESLGNKKIILNEECDVCNNLFGSSFENDIINLIDPMRIILGSKGKKASPKFKAGGYELYKKDDVVNIKVNEDYTSSEIRDVIFPASREVTPQNVYKALVKYSLSVIDDKYLSLFDLTKKWLRGDFSAMHLPNIAVHTPTNLSGPTVSVYIKYNGDKLIAFSELIACGHLWLFWVPTFTRKDCFDFDCLHTVCERYKLSEEDFSKDNYSLAIPKKIQHSIRFNLKSD